MKKFNLIVLDSVGAGALPDAANFGDVGASTLQHTYDYNKGLDLKNMQTMGLFNIEGAFLTSSGSPHSCLWPLHRKILR